MLPSTNESYNKTLYDNRRRSPYYLLTMKKIYREHKGDKIQQICRIDLCGKTVNYGHYISLQRRCFRNKKILHNLRYNRNSITHISLNDLHNDDIRCRNTLKGYYSIKRRCYVRTCYKN